MFPPFSFLFFGGGEVWGGQTETNSLTDQLTEIALYIALTILYIIRIVCQIDITNTEVAGFWLQFFARTISITFAFNKPNINS